MIVKKPTLLINVFSCLFLLVVLSINSYCQTPTASSDTKNPLIIRSGITAAAGLSELHISEDLLPNSALSKYYQFERYPFMKVGAMLSFQPGFFGKYFQLVTDPAFCKYSWGNFNYQRFDSIGNSIDIDVETIELPISLRFSFLPYSKTFQPFVRGGYSLAWILENEAQFQSKIYSDMGLIELNSTDFPFALFQHAVFFSAGMELNTKMIDLSLELVCQRNNGIDDLETGSGSKVSNYYLQIGILF